MYSSENWPFYEGAHDRLLQDLVKASKSFEMTAATSVGLSRKNWLDSLKTHFSYPKKDSALIKLYKEVMDEYKKPILELHTQSLSEEMIAPAWRWLALRETESEEKMIQIIHKGDRPMYHKIKAYELAKTEDQLHAEFSVDLFLFLEIERHYKAKEE